MFLGNAIIKKATEIMKAKETIVYVKCFLNEEGVLQSGNRIDGPVDYSTMKNAGFGMGDTPSLMQKTYAGINGSVNGYSAYCNYKDTYSILYPNSKKSFGEVYKELNP